METLAVEVSGVLAPIWNALCVALGLGLVIFFHELGHFAVAKWCGVHVERFSIGFGPILWSRQKGETEYALSAIPFGGYVKMLGQDDMDPGQMSDENIAQNPRSYSAKKVWQRMAIISAGVIMNIITACLFFTAAYGLGVLDAPAIVGGIEVGSTSWKQGIQMGDEITHVNGESIATFTDLSMEVALTTGPLNLRGRRVDGREFEVSVEPDGNGRIRQIGVGPTRSVRVPIPEKEGDPITRPGLPASKADPPFLPGDTIVSMNGRPTPAFATVKQILAEQADQPVDFELQRMQEDGTPGEKVVTTVQPMNFRSFGVYMEIGSVASLQSGSPAALAGMEEGDIITMVDGKQVGMELDPLQLPQYFANRADQEVEVVVRRRNEGSGDSDVTLSITPGDRAGWLQSPKTLSEPFPVAAIGAAYFVTTRIARVKPGSEAAAVVEDKTIAPGSRIVKVELVKTESGPDAFTDDNHIIDLEPKDDDGEKVPANWAFAFWLSQVAPHRDIVLHIENGDQTFARTLKKLELEEGMFLPIRGFDTEQLLTEQKGETFGQACTMGFNRTWKNVLQIYLTLRALFTGTISAKELHGPLGIAQVGYKVAKKGSSELMLFLGFLSVNLAVLNFLPIPILDGGHMVFLTYEAVAGKKPGERVLIFAQYVGLILILGLMFFVLWQDFARILFS